MQIQTTSDGFDLVLDGRLLLRHRSDAPCLFVGQGDARMDMYRGNFDIEDYVVERTPLAHAVVSGSRRSPSPPLPGQPVRLVLRVSGGDSDACHCLPDRGSVHQPDLAARRGRAGRARLGRRRADVVFRHARPPLSALDLGARRRARQDDGDHLQGGCRPARRAATTGTPTIRSRPISPLGAMRCMWRPRPIRLSISGKLTSTRSRSGPCPERIELTARPTFVALVEAMSERFGRQPPLPEWVYGGAIIGLKDGAQLLRAA